MVAQIAMEQFTRFVEENVRFSQEDFAILGLNMVGCAFFYYFMLLLKLPDHSWYLTLYSSGVRVLLRRVLLLPPGQGRLRRG